MSGYPFIIYWFLRSYSLATSALNRILSTSSSNEQANQAYYPIHPARSDNTGATTFGYTFEIHRFERRLLQPWDMDTLKLAIENGLKLYDLREEIKGLRKNSKQ